MEWIATLDVQKYSSVFPGIRSGKVILTDNQREHIIKRRGQEFFDGYFPFFREIIEDPDYIFRDERHAYTVIASKTVSLERRNIHLVIRLAVENDEQGLENSIITAMVENEKGTGKG